MVEQAKRIFYQRLRDFIYHIPGENPGPRTLCGINCFVLGEGQHRVMIEAGDYPERNSKFLENFTQFLNNYSTIQIDKIFITHAHQDHFGGLFDVLKLLKERGQDEPQVYKKLQGNIFEKEIFERFPSLVGKILDLKHNQQFTFDNKYEIRTLYTPGHADDHCSFVLKSPSFQEQYLFSGDIILGSPSTAVEELTTYMNTLYQLRKEEFSHICVPHSLNLDPESIIFDGRPKLEAYITYREERDKAIVDCLTKKESLTIQELYDEIYGSRGLTGVLKLAAETNLELHLEKLYKEGKIIKTEDQQYRVPSQSL